MNELRLM